MNACEAAEWASAGEMMMAAGFFLEVASVRYACVCARCCVLQLNNSAVGDKKMADAFGSTPRERGRMFVSHHYPDLDFPQAVWKALNLFCVSLRVCVVYVVCLVQERRARQWTWRT